MTKQVEQHHKLIIIGSGPAGLTAGIYAGRSKLVPLIIEGNKPGGQLMGTTTVENWPGEKGIYGPELMIKMQEHARHVGCSFLSEQVIQTDLPKKPFTIITHRNRTLTADALIVASGAVAKRLDVTGEQEYWGKGITTCAVCDAALYQDKRVIIVGGGDTSMEFAVSLLKFTKEITLIQVLDKLTASAAMQERVFEQHNVQVIYQSTIEAIRGNGKWVTGVTVVNKKNNSSHELPTDGIFLAIGLRPNTSFVENQLELDRLGYIRTIKHSQTSVAGVFAAGDVTDSRYRQAITSAGSGCMAALDAERFLESINHGS
jgi:thioredoxin reductase (NADPH)